MKKSIAIILVGTLSGIFSSCVPSTPQYRIQQHPQAFEQLSEKHKELVSRGEIAEGMSKDAVSLAWGSPNSRAGGLRNGRMFDRWDYEGQRAVVTNNIFGGYNSGYYGPYRYSGVGGGFGPQVTYIPYRKSSVWFDKDKVDGWESER